MNPACPELSSAQKLIGMVSFLGIMEIGAICLAVACVLVLFRHWAKWLLERLLPFLEATGWVVALGLILRAHWEPPADQLWFILPGSLLFAGMTAWSAHIRKIEPNFTRFAFMCMIVWGAIALFYSSEVIAFLSVGALMAFLGFEFHVLWGGYALGFKNDDALQRSTTAAFALLLIAVAAKVLAPPSPPILLFRDSVFWIAGFVGYLGLLIASSRWYRHRTSYMVMQLITITAGVLALWAGSVFDINILRGIGGTFFVLYLIEKPFEIPAKSTVGFALIGLFVAGSVGAGVYWAQHNMELIRPYLLF